MIRGFHLCLPGLILRKSAGTKGCPATTGWWSGNEQSQDCGSCGWILTSQMPPHPSWLSMFDSDQWFWTVSFQHWRGFLRFRPLVQQQNDVRKLNLCYTCRTHSLAQQHPGCQSSSAHRYALPFEMGSHKWDLKGKQLRELLPGVL